MKKTLAMLMASSAIALASSAYAADESAQVKSNVEYKKDGGYSSTRSAEKTNASGTHVTSESDVDVDVDSKGRVDKKMKVESKTDPKGLMNAKGTTKESSIEEKERGGYKQKETRKSTDKEGADTTNKAVTDVSVDKDGTVNTTTTTEKTVDPKGLMNSKTTTEKVKSVNGNVIEHKKD